MSFSNIKKHLYERIFFGQGGGRGALPIISVFIFQSLELVKMQIDPPTPPPKKKYINIYIYIQCVPEKTKPRSIDALS